MVNAVVEEFLRWEAASRNTIDVKRTDKEDGYIAANMVSSQ